MQMLRLRQTLGDQVKQARGVPEMFAQKGDGMFPYGQEPMHMPSEKQAMDVFAKNEKWLGSPPTPETNKWTSRELETLGYVGDLTAWAMQAS